jgi:hypothetical protein
VLRARSVWSAPRTCAPTLCEFASLGREPSRGCATTEALAYAAVVAPRVLALHIRPSGDSEIEQAWASRGSTLPLVIVDADNRDCAHAFDQAMQVLLRTEQLEQITVVVPARGELGDWRDAVSAGHSVVVERLP